MPKKPVVNSIDLARSMLMEQRIKKKTNSTKWRGELVPFEDDHIKGITTKKDYFIIRQLTRYRELRWKITMVDMK